jgi:hypothetical protein
MNRLRLALLGIAIAFAAAILAAGCSSKEDPEQAKVFENMPETLKNMMKHMKAEGPMPELRVESEFEEKLRRKKYPEAEPPKDKEVFRWDFSKKHKYVYDYTSRARGTTFGIEQKALSSATITVKAKGDRTADIIVGDLDTKLDMGIEERELPEYKEIMDQVRKLQVPDMVLQGFKEDSTLPGEHTAPNLLTVALLPLPAEPLAPGGSTSIPRKEPFNAFGSLLWVKGATKTTLKGYVTIEGHRCARLDLRIDVSKLDVPEELPGKYACSIVGVGTCYFDMVDKCYHSVELAIVQSVRAETAGFGPNPGEAIRMVIDADSLVRITRSKSKEKEANED